MNINRQIDHIVYAVPDLEAACQHIENTLGIRPQFGGYHKTKGTMNALLNIGNACYLEILAIDKSNTAIEPPRWMGIDLLDHPRISRWSLKSDQLEQDQKQLQKFDETLGQQFGGTRQTPAGDTLSWNMILPLAHPAIDIIPFMTDWAGSSIHPTDRLKDECQLTDISFSHPEADRIQSLFQQLAIDKQITTGEVAISISLTRAERRITLS